FDVIIGGADDDAIDAPTGGKIILGDSGRVNLVGDDRDVFSIDEGVGGIDHIIGGADGVGNIILGGAAGDTISGGSGDDVILGDSGWVHRAATRVLSVNTTAPAIGGVGDIGGGGGVDVILGGANGDTIRGGAGKDTILGDGGHLHRTSALVLTLIETTAPAIGGADDIGSGGGDDVVFGGTGNDTINAGEGNNVVIGDNGAIDYVAETVVSTVEPGDAKDD